ncbi:uncharacterized protein [Ptychodera flava]|uniref:uncharacterized protein n=1 Tax=Ptychodera flava TaxID=63121 RepID=UPI003969EAC4
MCNDRNNWCASLLPGGQTIHRFSGVMDGRFTDHELARKIIHEPEMKEVKMNILNTELLVIDEVSMLSAKIFLQIEAVFRMVRKSSLPFGGMQVVLSGDLYQLKPVPNIAYNDPGCMFIKAEQFKNLVPHCFFLSTVHRQTENDLIEAINLCCRGEIKNSVTNLLKRLQRPLPPGETPVKLFALNYDVDISNANHLMAMEGEMKLFRADDTGEIKLLSKCTAPKTLHLKETCNHQDLLSRHEEVNLKEGE